MPSKLFRALTLASIGLAGPSLAAPWIKPDDLSARLQVEYLASQGLIRSPITQWPLMWGSILPDLRLAQNRKLSPQQQRTVDSLLAQFEQDSAPTQVTLSAGTADQEVTAFGGFGDSNNAPQFASVSAGFVGRRWAGELQVSYDVPDYTWEHRKLDGSYLAGAFGNWGLTIGAIDRWWGPGWQSSPILSNNARPVPALSIARNKALPFENFFLSWLGPWQLQAFIGELESNRAVPNAKLLGMRFSVKPAYWLELGATRTAQWGGDGRPQDFSSFADLVVGKDNRGDSGITLENEPGNQLAGLDFKISVAVPWGSQGAYGQFIGQDESGYAPSRYIYTAGLDGSIVARQHTLQWFFERSDTRASALSNNPRLNYSYEHAVYESGYRYKGRTIGASIDSDSTINTLGLTLLLPNRDLAKMTLSNLTLNPDGGKRTGFRGEGAVAEVSYTANVLNGQIEVGYRYVDDDIRVAGLGNDGVNTLFIETVWRW
ncbi:capsule assembly Wzi family protein [Spongiibacter taiwanensis]|uniref:capsule assembly Wzi family protein n=1 Tax=Spongiibacter taiwanensis TaxID=1748242 RepID=UPI002034E3AF|nr:capsule assembly Wzi family protein [Spongiibacter taiwanensis]USA42134.1 capsule assembly Wzi family protein [Spongiibacter taiwanensis]